MHEGRTIFLTGLRESDLSPLAVFHPLFTRIGIDENTLIRAVPENRRSATDDVGAIIGDRVLSALESFDAGEHALLIAVDDADVLPPSCIAVLGYVARRLAKTRVFLVLVSGTGVDPRLQPLPQLPMYTMTLAESRALIKSVTGEEPPLSTLFELHRIGHGNPVDVRELCEQLTTDQLTGLAALPEPAVVADSRTARWRDVVSNLTAAQRTALTVLSIVRTVEPGHLIQALRSEFDSGSDFDTELAALVSAGHVESIRHVVQVRNHLDRAAIYTIAAPKLRSDCHRIVEAHSLLGERPALATANRAFTADPIVVPINEMIRRTDELALNGEASLAVQVLRTALDTSDAVRRSRLAAHALRIVTGWGFFADAAQFTRYIEPQLLPPGEAAEATVAQLLLNYLQDEAFDEVSARNIVDALTSRCPDSASRLAGVVGYLHVCRNDTEEARRVLAAVDRICGSESGPVHAVSLAMAHLAVVDGTPEPADRQLSSRVAKVREKDCFAESVMSTHMLQKLGRHHDAMNDLERLSTKAISPVERAIVMALRVDGELFAGSIDAARALWDEAETLVPAENCLPSLRLSQRIQILGLIGRFQEVDELADRIHATPFSRAYRTNESRLLWALGQIALMRGDYVSSISLLEQSIDAFDTVGGCWQLQRHVDLIEAFVRSGQPEMGDKVLRTLGARLGARQSPSTKATFARGELLVAKSPDEARMALSRALGPRTAPAPTLERARAHAIYADRLRDESENISHQHPLRTAHALFTRIGALGWADAVGASSATDESTDLRLDQLTEQENQIVELALQGLRNRDIARRMFLAQRTVEKRLTAVFRKLGVRSRAELFAFVAPEDQAGSGAAPLAPHQQIS